MSDWIFAVAGVLIALATALLFMLLEVPSGDPIIQPEGEPDPGKRRVRAFDLDRLWTHGDEPGDAMH